MSACRFLEPLDVLFLHGNKLFGDPGSYGESLIPPWPSVAAGAIRSQMLAEENIDLCDFAEGTISHPSLGTPAKPGSFTLVAFTLARRHDDGLIESLHPLPADLIASRIIVDRDKEEWQWQLQQLIPGVPDAAIIGSFPLPKWPLLASDTRTKPTSGVWLTQAGWQCYLDGKLPGTDKLVESQALWKLDPRIGIGLDAERRCAEEGKLFTTQAVALESGHGFLALIDGAEPPRSGTLRLGGDGRAAAVQTVEYQQPEPEYESLSKAGRCRIVLTSPGLFPDGWRLPGCDPDNRFQLGTISARLVCAAVPRTEIVSGWDLACRRPKPAQRVAPPGSVYWLEDLQATPETLRKLASNGLWPDDGYNAMRRAEGFNRFTFATY